MTHSVMVWSCASMIKSQLQSNSRVDSCESWGADGDFMDPRRIIFRPLIVVGSDRLSWWKNSRLWWFHVTIILGHGIRMTPTFDHGRVRPRELAFAINQSLSGIHPWSMYAENLRAWLRNLEKTKALWLPQLPEQAVLVIIASCPPACSMPVVRLSQRQGSLLIPKIELFFLNTDIWGWSFF